MPDRTRLRFIVPGVMGKQRPRHMRNGHTYTPTKTTEFEQMVAYLYREACIKHFGFVRKAERHAPVTVEIDITRPLPKSRPKGMESEPDTFKPDVDNIAKIVLDGLNGVAYEDDSQVTSLHVMKWNRSRLHLEDEMWVTVTF